MEKKTLLGFALIFGAIFLFNSDFYFNKILGRPSPQQESLKKQKEAQEGLRRVSDSLSMSAPSAAPSIAVPSVSPVLSAVPKTAPAPISAGISKPLIVETPLFICRIERKGARITSWKMKGYAPEKPGDTSRTAELLPQNTAGALNLAIGGQSFDSLDFECRQMPGSDTVRVLGKNDSLLLTLNGQTPAGEGIEKILLFRGNDWRVDLRLKKTNMGASNMELGWMAGLRVIDRDTSKAQSQGSGPGGYAGFLLWGDEVEEVGDFKDDAREYSGLVRWAGIKEGYFGFAIIPQNPSEATVEFYQDTREKEISQMRMRLKQDFESEEIAYQIFAGPLKYSLVKSYQLGLEGIIFQGWDFLWAYAWFPPLCGFVLWLLDAFFKLFPDYGVSIILLTILSRAIMIPLTQKSQKSMAAMKDLQPKITEIRARFKADPAKMNQEVMKLYKKHGVSPFGAGCLPMVMQMPIFIALFVALRKAVELRGADTFLPWVHDLSKPDVIFALPFTIPFYGAEVCLLPILMAIATYFQSNQTMKDPNQRMLVYFMPVFLLFLFNSFPSGLNLYWTLSTAIGILQQWLTERKKGKTPVQTAPVKA